MNCLHCYHVDPENSARRVCFYCGDDEGYTARQEAAAAIAATASGGSV